MARTLYVTLALEVVIHLSLSVQKADAWPLNPAVTLPATSTIKHMLVFILRPVTYAPTPPGLYYNRAAWTHRGFLGTLIVASYSKAPNPVGAYNELIYIPGRCSPCANAPWDMHYESVARAWVDNKASIEVCAAAAAAAAGQAAAQLVCCGYVHTYQNTFSAVTRTTALLMTRLWAAWQLYGICCSCVFDLCEQLIQNVSTRCTQPLHAA
jgi:hypothetical protein